VDAVVLVGDRDIVRRDRWFPVLTAVTLLLPAVFGGLLTWSWAGTLTGFFWAGLGGGHRT
jgi:stearoyl-CoA desaturase (delta-9 desaturase)